MDNLILQIIINKIEKIVKEQINISNLKIIDRKKIKTWSIKMYKEFEKNNELNDIKNNNLSDKDFEEYIDNDYILYL